MERTKTILVVDDDEAILQSIQSVLELEGYLVEVSGSGREAMAKSALKSYDLALLDIKLPDIEGTELLRKMRGSFPKMMKVMVTGHPELNNAIESLNNGADAYLMKPIKPKILLDTVRKKLKEQEEALKMNDDKVRKWIESRIKKLKNGDM